MDGIAACWQRQPVFVVGSDTVSIDGSPARSLDGTVVS
jgi:hypothetical protein